jgi:peptidyl-prolyl cis-trans isomerase SurA
MSILKKIILTITSILFLIINSNAVENKILFKINNEIITSLDIFDELKYLVTLNNELRSIENAQKFEIAKNSLIREKIKEIELKKKVNEIKIEEGLLQNVLIDYFKKENFQSISDFENYFLKVGINPDSIKRKITIEILWNQLIYSKYIQSVKIDKKEIKDDLLNNNKQKEFLLSEILFNINEGEQLDLKFKSIKDSIKEKSFSETAIIFSISDTANKGGKLGWIKEASMNLKIKKQLDNIKIGNHTNPIVIPGGFLILKKEDYREVNIDIDFEKEFEIIIKEKTNKQLNQFSNIYFNKIKKNIVINEL